MKIQLRPKDGFVRNSFIVALASVCALIAFVYLFSHKSSSVILNRKSVSVALQTSHDGFGFPNFTSAATLEQFNTSDLQRISGSAVCINGVETPCVPTAEASAWAQMVNQARQTGHCEGLAVVSASRFAQHLTPATSTLTNEGDVTHAIFRSFATQFFPNVRDKADSWINKSMTEKLAALSTELSAGRLTYTLGLYTDHGGHALLPYALEFGKDDSAIIRVYDSNWPGKNRFVKVNLATAKWSFSFSNPKPDADTTPWTGGAKDLDLVAMGTRIDAQSPFGGVGVQTTLMLVRSPSTDWTISTDSGVVGPRQSTASGRAKPLHVDSRHQIPEYIVQVKSRRISLHLPGAASVFVVKPTSIVRVTSVAPVNAPIEVGENSINSVGDGTVVSVASGDNAVTVKDETASIKIEDGSLTVDIADTHEMIVANESRPHITIEHTSNGVSISNGSEMEGTDPVLPPALTQKVDLPDLPPAVTRDMFVDGYQIDTYVPPADSKVVSPASSTESADKVYVETIANSSTTSSSTTMIAVPVTSTTVMTSTSAPSTTQVSNGQLISNPTTTTTATTTVPPVPTGTTTTTTTVPTTTSTLPPTTTTTTTTLPPTTTTTTTVPATCATGGVCAVGDVGPGGGKVFYVAAPNAGYGWKYLEVAPTNAATAIKWCNNDVTLLPGTFGRSIGTGAANTAAILAASACTSGSAASAADSYVSPNGTSDWFLPSILELHEMYPNKTLVGMPSSRNFWSSSQNSNIYAEAQSYLDGGNPSWFKTNYIDYDVRGIRSFGVG